MIEIKESTDIMVSHPNHYQTASGAEVIDIIESLTSGLTGILAVDVGNAIKYLFRYKKKNGIQDVEKARWYMIHLYGKIDDGQIIKRDKAGLDIVMAIDDIVECEKDFSPRESLYVKNSLFWILNFETRDDVYTVIQCIDKLINILKGDVENEN